jgi:hypothetical protein
MQAPIINMRSALIGMKRTESDPNRHGAWLSYKLQALECRDELEDAGYTQEQIDAIVNTCRN